MDHCQYVLYTYLAQRALQEQFETSDHPKTLQAHLPIGLDWRTRVARVLMRLAIRLEPEVVEMRREHV